MENFDLESDEKMKEKIFSLNEPESFDDLWFFQFL